MAQRGGKPALAGAILGNLVDGYGVVAVAFIGRAIEQVWKLQPAELGLVFASGPAGMMLGSLLIAPLADRFGRRKIALASLALVSLAMFAAAATTNVVQLLFALLITGMGIGGVLATLNTLVAEIANPARRNVTMAIFSAGYPLGSTLAGVFAIGLMGQFGWPVVFIIGGGIAGLAFLLNLVTLPEPEGRGGPGGPLPRGAMREALFGAGRRGTTMAICAAFFLNMLTFYFILLWTARLSTGSGLTQDEGATVMTIVNVGSLVGPLLFGLLADRFGLRRMATAYFCLFALTVALFAGTGSVFWAIAVIAALVGMAMAGAMTSLYASTPLLFAQHARAAGTGLAIGIGRLGATLGPMLAGLGLQIGLGRSGLYLMFAVAPLLVALLLLSGRIDPPKTIESRGAAA